MTHPVDEILERGDWEVGITVETEGDGNVREAEFSESDGGSLEIDYSCVVDQGEAIEADPDVYGDGFDWDRIPHGALAGFDNNGKYVTYEWRYSLPYGSGLTWRQRPTDDNPRPTEFRSVRTDHTQHDSQD